MAARVVLRAGGAATGARPRDGVVRAMGLRSSVDLPSWEIGWAARHGRCRPTVHIVSGPLCASAAPPVPRRQDRRRAPTPGQTPSSPIRSTAVSRCDGNRGISTPPRRARPPTPTDERSDPPRSATTSWAGRRSLDSPCDVLREAGRARRGRNDRFTEPKARRKSPGSSCKVTPHLRQKALLSCENNVVGITSQLPLRVSPVTSRAGAPGRRGRRCGRPSARASERARSVLRPAPAPPWSYPLRLRRMRPSREGWVLLGSDPP